MLNLVPNQIDLWLAFPGEIQDARLLEEYRRLLTTEERIKERSFRFGKDRHCYLVTRALIRTTLSRYASVAADHWMFSTNAYGKPHITNTDPVAERISFNISHTHGLVALGITKDKPIGLDAENVCYQTAPIEMAQGLFSSIEVASLYALPEEKRHELFFQYWTLKESYIKARGLGLTIPLDQFFFLLRHDDSRPNITFLSSQNKLDENWSFWQFQVAAEYLLAICADCSVHTNQKILIKKIVPLVKEDVATYKLIAQS